MRKVIAIGETILDIIFRNGTPEKAVPGGSSFNCIVSAGRAGLPACFIGEVGQDAVGEQITRFLRDNRVDDRYLKMIPEIQTAISLAFLDGQGDAHYTFYKQPPKRLHLDEGPEIAPDDVMQFGSYYAINPDTRDEVRAYLAEARRRGAILFYDINFRRSHLSELPALLPAICENYSMAHVVRGSADDFEIMYSTRDVEYIYRNHIAPYCPYFICTQGADGITLCTPALIQHYEVPALKAVSTIGAGDNFNAGFIYGLIRYGVRRADMEHLDAPTWAQLIDCGRIFSANVCQSWNNYIDEDLGERMAQALPSPQ